MRLAVLIFFLMLLFGSCSRKKAYNVAGCSDVWNGRFFEVQGGETTLEILRKGDTQIERLKDGNECKLKVEWLDSCTYRLSYMSCKRAVDEQLTGAVVVQITKVTDASYTIEGWMEGSTLNTYTTEIFRAR